jgi:aspartyl-tRNA(Asn)/glutamyl-tRNA(Gln) amidotransferase subunit B
VVANWVTGELAAAEREGDAEAEDAAHVPPESLAQLIGMVEAKTISHGAGRQVLAVLVAEGGDPPAIVEREGLAAVSDEGELGAIVERALEAEPEAAEQVRSGNMKAVGPLVGLVMRETRGAADGGEVTRLIREKLGL